MLELLHLKNVGPAPELKMELAPRLNLITGDNGLGKTLLLDAAWYVLTRTWPFTWPGKGIVPTSADAAIGWRERRGSTPLRECQAVFEFGSGRWGARLMMPWDEEASKLRSLVVYARVDGGYSVADPLRVGQEYRLPFGQAAMGTSSCFQFTPVDVWDGLNIERNTTFSRVCEGLLRDWLQWAMDPSSGAFARFSAIVKALSPGEGIEPLKKWERIYLDDARNIPMLKTPAGEVPIIHASAAIRRMLGLAYVLVWTWEEHQIAARLKKVPPLDTLVLLFDELETHLHPRWQRQIAPAIVAAGKALDASIHLQTLMSTHSPLVLASLEPHFDADHDAWFDLDLETASGAVFLAKRPFVRRGTAGRWLTSEAFDLASEGRSLEAEKAIGQAEALLERRRNGESLRREDVESVDQSLRRVLSDVDRFWVRWSAVVDELLEAS